MRNILLAILVSTSALLTGCTDDLSMDERDIEAQPIDESAAAHRPELAAQTDGPTPTERTAVAGLAGSESPCPIPPPKTDSLDVAAAKRDVLDEAPADFCAELPSDGPCSLACDPDKLVDQFVPKGQCVTYRCELASGEVFRTGGCNP